MAVVFDPLLGRLRMADQDVVLEPGVGECDCESITTEEIEEVVDETTDNN